MDISVPQKKVELQPMDTFEDAAENSTVVSVKPNTKDIKLMNQNNPEEQTLNPFSFAKHEPDPENVEMKGSTPPDDFS